MKKTRMNAIRVHKPGGPEVLRYEGASRSEPKAGKGLIHVSAAGADPAGRQGVTLNAPHRSYP